MPSKKTAKKLGDLLKQASGSSPRPVARAAVSEAAALVVKSITLTPGALTVLDRLMRELAKKSQRRVSASAVIRALLRDADARGVDARIASLVEAEMTTGEVVWGKGMRRSA